MTDLTPKPFTRVHWQAYQAWHDDQELSRRASFPDETWFAYVSALTADGGIVAFENDQAHFVSMAQFDIIDDAMALFIAVNPEHRKRGYGKKTLNAIIASAPLTIAAIDGFIEQDNAASIAMAALCGFKLQQEAPDKEGFLHWRLAL